jgi:hypothetical protein
MMGKENLIIWGQTLKEIYGMKRFMTLLCILISIAMLAVIGCTAGGGSGDNPEFYVSFTVNGDRNVTWTKGDTNVSSDAAARDTGKGGIQIEAFPVEVSGVDNVHNEVDNGIALLTTGMTPGIYSGDDMQTQFALDGTGYASESSGTIEIISIGGVGEVVEGTFTLSYTLPSALDITNGRFRVLLYD